MNRAALRMPGVAPVLAVLAAVLLLAPASGLCAGAKPWFEPGSQNATGQAPSEGNATAVTAPQQAKPADDPEKRLQEEVLRTYYRRMLTLDPSLPDLFSRRVRDKEALALEIMRQTQARRGLLKAFADARVYLDELVFERIEQAPDLARWKVRGQYHLAVSSSFESEAERALFVLLPEDGGWKIWERWDD